MAWEDSSSLLSSASSGSHCSSCLSSNQQPVLQISLLMSPYSSVLPDMRSGGIRTLAVWLSLCYISSSSGRGHLQRVLGTKEVLISGKTRCLFEVRHSFVQMDSALITEKGHDLRRGIFFAQSIFWTALHKQYLLLLSTDYHVLSWVTPSVCVFVASLHHERPGAEFGFILRSSIQPTHQNLCNLPSEMIFSSSKKARISLKKSSCDSH